MSARAGALISNNQQLRSDSIKKELIMVIATKLPSTVTELRKLIPDKDDLVEYTEGILNVIEACSDPKKYWCMCCKRGALHVLYNSAATLPIQD